MQFPVSGVEVSPLALILLGFTVGVLGGFFGAGGSFIVGPMMFFLGVPFNFVVGTDLAHIMAKSIVATRRHRALGHVDLRLGLIMVLGTAVGVEAGARVVEYLKRTDLIDLVLGLTYVVILVSVSTFVAWESLRGLRMQRAQKVKSREALSLTFFRRVHAVHLPPMIRLRTSGIEQISVWAIVGVGAFTGFFGGLLGGGASYLRLPSLIYFLGVPTHIAVGTDLFEIVISAGFGTLTHGLKGNVDALMALVMLTGAAIGAQIGSELTVHVGGPKIRLTFSAFPVVGAILVLYRLFVTGTLGL